MDGELTSRSQKRLMAGSAASTIQYASDDEPLSGLRLPGKKHFIRKEREEE